MIEISIAPLVVLCCVCFSLGIAITNLIWVINVFRCLKKLEEDDNNDKTTIAKNRHSN